MVGFAERAPRAIKTDVVRQLKVQRTYLDENTGLFS